MLVSMPPFKMVVRVPPIHWWSLPKEYEGEDSSNPMYPARKCHGVHLALPKLKNATMVFELLHVPDAERRSMVSYTELLKSRMFLVLQPFRLLVLKQEKTQSLK